MNIPYKTKSGLQIGKYYQKPRYVEQDTDMLQLQSFLIHDPARLKRQYWINKFLMYLSVLTVLVVIFKS